MRSSVNGSQDIGDFVGLGFTRVSEHLDILGLDVSLSDGFVRYVFLCLGSGGIDEALFDRWTLPPRWRTLRSQCR